MIGFGILFLILIVLVVLGILFWRQTRFIKNLMDWDKPWQKPKVICQEEPLEKEDCPGCPYKNHCHFKKS